MGRPGASATPCWQALRRHDDATTIRTIGPEFGRLIHGQNTRAVLVEAPGSQSFEIQDVPAIAAAAHARGLCVIMDNTWATPLFFPGSCARGGHL